MQRMPEMTTDRLNALVAVVGSDVAAEGEALAATAGSVLLFMEHEGKGSAGGSVHLAITGGGARGRGVRLGRTA